MKLFDIFRRKKSYSVAEVMELLGRSLGVALKTNEEAFEKVEYVYDCVKTRAQKVASIHWRIYNITNKGEKIRNEKLESMFRNPNPLTTSTQFIESIVAWLDLRGISYIHINGPFLEVLDSDMTTIGWKDNTPTGDPADLRFIHYRNGKQEIYTPDEVKIIRNFTPYARIQPVSTLSAVFGTVEIQENQDRAIAKLMEKGAYIPAVLTGPGEYTADQVKLIQKVWKERYSGISNAGENIPVFGGGLQVQKIGLTPADMDILKRENLTKDRIYSAFGVPKKDFQNLNRATAEVQQEFFIRTTIMPFADAIAEQITKFILNNQAQFVFEYETLPEMQGDLLIKAQVDEIHVRNGIKTINEVRVQYGLKPVPWGNTYWGPLNLTEIGIEAGDNSKSTLVALKEAKSKKTDLIWKNFVARTTPEENKLAKELMKYWKKQEKFVLDYIYQQKSFKFPKSWNDVLAKLLKTYLIAFMQQAGDAQAAVFGISFDLQKPEIQRWLAAKVMTSAVEINTTTKRDVLKQLKEAVENGESIQDMEKRIKGLFEETYKHRAQTVARTEVISANNKAGLEAAKQANMGHKVWITALDERTRPWHAEADGQTVGIDEPFIVEGEELDFPGDPKGSPENIINCRCTMTYAP